MALKIRLARAGSKKRPYYHVVIADVRAPRDGRFIERVGSWNPTLPKDGERVVLNEDRIKHWMSQGAQPTDRVLRFLDQAGIAKRTERNNPQKALPGKKAKERVDQAAKKAEDAKAAAAAAAEAETAAKAEAETAAKEAAEAPAEEAAAEAPAEEAAAEAPAEETAEKGAAEEEAPADKAKAE